jgi:hypothetical protein
MGKTIETQGWISSDFESASIENQECGLLFEYPDEREPNLVRDTQLESFEKLVVTAKRSTFGDTKGQVFAVIQGEFETRLVDKGESAHLNGPGFGVQASIPSRLVLKRVVCSSTAAAATTTELEALSRCKATTIPKRTP